MFVYLYTYFICVHIQSYAYMYMYIYIYRSAEREDANTVNVCAHRSSPLSHVVFAGGRGQLPALLVSLMASFGVFVGLF
jgi:hypothetical protein